MPSSPTAKMLEKIIDQTPLTQREIAQRVGFPKPNVMSMMKNGEMKVPIERIPALAAACDVDPLPLLSCAMEEYAPAAWRVLHAQTGEPVSEDEMIFLKAYRAATFGRRLVLSRTLQVSLVEFFKALRSAYDAARPDG